MKILETKTLRVDVADKRIYIAGGHDYRPLAILTFVEWNGMLDAVSQVVNSPVKINDTLTLTLEQTLDIYTTFGARDDYYSPRHLESV